MLKDAKTWFFDLFFPVVHYRTAPYISHDVFKSNILLRKLDNYAFSHYIEQPPLYSLCYEIDWQDACKVMRRYRFMFSICAINALVEMDVGFHANTRKKLYAAFAYDFSTKQIDNVCRLNDIELPDIAIAEMKKQILHRGDDEALRVGPFIVLKPKESLEEVLIERDLMH